MTTNDTAIITLHNLLDHDARKFTSAEIELKNSLHEWINNTGSFKLTAVLQKYLEYTEEHVKKLEDFFEEEHIVSLCYSNRVMQALIAETAEKLALCTDAPIKDACLLAAVQAINHFKISMYGTAAAFALGLGMESQAAIFHEAEVNEKQIDDRLSQLAAYEINIKASTPIALNG